MKTFTGIVTLLILVLACALVAWLPEPCTGGVYADHPGLRAECLHNLAYPGPGDDAYPAPDATQITTPDAATPAPTLWEPTPTSPWEDPNQAPCTSGDGCGG